MADSLVKKVKQALMKEAVGEDPPAAYVAQSDIMDMVLTDYLSPAPRAPKEMTQQALIGAVAMCHDKAKELTIEQIDAVIARVKGETPASKPAASKPAGPKP